MLARFFGYAGAGAGGAGGAGITYSRRWRMNIFIHIRGSQFESCFLDWLARGILYTPVLRVEMEVGKSAIYALLSQRRKCHDLRTLTAKKINPGLRSKKKQDFQP